MMKAGARIEQLIAENDRSYQGLVVLTTRTADEEKERLRLISNNRKLARILDGLWCLGDHDAEVEN